MEYSVVCFDELAAQGLAEAARRFADLFEQVMLVVTAIDVSSGDLCGGDVVVGDRQGGAVVTDSIDTLYLAGECAIEAHDLASTRAGVIRVGRGFAVHADVSLGFFDDTVWLGGHDEAVLREADVDRLSAAAKREEQVVGRFDTGEADGDRSFEHRYRPTERFGDVVAFAQVL